MKKETIKYIIALMCVALAGLILLQFYWVKNTLYVQEEFFDQAVARAMNEVVSKVEKKQAADFMTARLRSLMAHHSSPKGVCKHVKIIKQGNHIQGTIIIEDDSLQVPNSRHYKNFKKFYFNKNPSGLDIPTGPFVIDNNDFAVIDSQFSRMGDQNILKNFLDSIMLGAPRIRLLRDLFKDMFMGAEFYKTINPQVLSNLIKDALVNQGIDIYYVFGIYNSVEGRVDKASSKEYVPELTDSPYKANIYAEGIFNKPYFLSLYFPGKNKFLFRKMSVVLIASAVLFLLIVFCFGYTVNIVIQQKKLSQMKTDFINNMTHEFKTPVSTILLASEALKDPQIKENPERMSRLVNMIHEENNRISGHVERVLQLAALEKANFRLTKQEVDMHELINRVVQGMIIQVETKNGQILMDLRATNILITGDEHHLSNVIYNLLDNAIKYCVLIPHIVVSTRNYREGILMSVSDNGIGLTREQQNRIFEQFYRVSTGNIHDVKGFGLGLHYVEAVVDAHGGNISVQSEKGKGSTFEIYLPKNIHHEQNENIVS